MWWRSQKNAIAINNNMKEENKLSDFERTELEAYRKIFDELLKDQNSNKASSNNNKPNKQKMQDKIAYWLGVFISFGIITITMTLCWNFSLVQLWPQIPQITIIQMGGLWFLFSTLLSIKNK